MDSLLQLIDHHNVHHNSHKSFLMEKSLKKNEAKLGPDGELIINTGTHTGRSANDKYVVIDENTQEKIWWENNINKMDEDTFLKLRLDVINYLKSEKELFYTQRSIGSTSSFSLGIEFISTHASSALFTQYMFKSFVSEGHNNHYKIIHAPKFKLDTKIYGTRSDTVIVTSFKNKTTIIVGTHYAGEIKKSMFSIMNYLLPDLGILPMHSGANQNSLGDSFVFFGLSGTGKTTLSTDEGLDLIGDDEHGMSEKGIFNFEGGCYAKTYKLSRMTEPDIFAAATQYSSFLENVQLADDRSFIDFFDGSLTENGRASYPLTFIKKRVEGGTGKIPKNIFYLSADAFGVLPPVSLLTTDQATTFFELGYSAKLAGTEIGIKTPQATFSACFGAPFMLQPPQVYSKLLNDFIKKHSIQVWLINTGWYGGSYGTGTRFPLEITRNIIRQIQSEKLSDAEFIIDKIFNLKIPKNVAFVDASLLVPENAWADKKKYHEVAQKLAASFKEQLKTMGRN